MYYKKVWIIILIIVIMGGLFPSVLIAKAEDEYPDDEIPDLEFSLQDAPFPGTYEGLTEYRWQQFIDRAESLGHNTIFQLTSYTVHYIAGNSKNFTIDEPIFFSVNTSTGGVGKVTEIIDRRDSEEYYEFLAHFKYLPDTHPEMHLEHNVINKNGHNSYIVGVRNNWFLHQFHVILTRKNSGSRYKPENMPVNINYHFVPWYSGEITNDPYQDIPERYNIDPQRGYGMSFLKPAFGDWINIPHKLGTYKDFIEIEIQVPQIYERESISYRMFNVSEGIGQMAIPNFAIKLYSHNVKKIEGSQVVGRDGIWILPNKITFVEGFMDGSYMHSAKFLAKVPIEHAKPIDGGHSLIVADLVLREVAGIENYSVEIPEARTWTKYLTYLGTVDADGDGFDDRTGLPIDKGEKPGESIKDDKPNRDDYEDDILGTISYYFDTFIWYIKQPFVFIADLIGNIINWISTTIDGWIDGFSSIFTTLFSFLPAEVILMLALGFGTMMIITIIRAIRGS